MTENILEVNGLTKKVQGSKKIVDGLSFDMRKGEILGLLGPNGAGKTTTIRMIVGLMSKTEGSVTINGRDLDEEARACRADVGAIVENPAFYEYMSGYKNLKLSARMAKDKVTEERITEVVSLVKLEDAIQDKVKKYSLGMKQRLGVAQAILHRPSLLILDEPTNGLDPKGIRELRDYLRELADEGISTLVSSHLLSEMQLMCDRVVIMEKGKVIDISDLASLNAYGDEDQVVVALTVKKGQGAGVKTVLGAMDQIVITASEKENELLLDMSRDQIPVLNRALVKAGVDVFGIESKRTSLEDKFLQLTGKGAK
ncbi:bacitracin ABC transporter ATP-binding protein [Alteribacter lacisalsi]|uniref:Bacitracin ABC transporter ATP-binding protein n=1 Tax=Alteribacter lacisalsi TaxID=2045244 RepID=A0A2W0HGJ7_9BACI|nr:ABC transporter ATP-binding protein [Alteribacter lacisalsi]PYZ96545.1 bacitracin ABC transporter ATP-binding protein [Alteribacter lacisalsi]